MIDPERPVFVFGGPYSNLRAAEAARHVALQMGFPPGQCLCTGDIVAYCAEPEETTRFVRDWGCHVIAGNCEEQLASGADNCGCGFEEGTACDLLAKGWYPFANSRISRDSREWMAGLPQTYDFVCGQLRARAVHGGVSQNNKFIFASQREVVRDELSSVDTDIVIGGHCGIPFIGRHDDKVWFNPGVIGMPANDGTPDGWFGIMAPRPNGVRLTTHRLVYDFASTAAAMRRWSYADTYATSIVTGIWPSFDILPRIERAATGKRIRPASLTVPRRRASAGDIKEASQVLP